MRLFAWVTLLLLLSACSSVLAQSRGGIWFGRYLRNPARRDLNMNGKDIFGVDQMEATSGAFNFLSVGGSPISSPSIASLTDTNVTTLADSHFLRWDAIASEWFNVPASSFFVTLGTPQLISGQKIFSTTQTFNDDVFFGPHVEWNSTLPSFKTVGTYWSSTSRWLFNLMGGGATDGSDYFLWRNSSQNIKMGDGTIAATGGTIAWPVIRPMWSLTFASQSWAHGDRKIINVPGISGSPDANDYWIYFQSDTYLSGAGDLKLPGDIDIIGTIDAGGYTSNTGGESEHPAGITANPGGGTGNEIYGDGAGNATLSGSDNSGLGYLCLNALTSGKYNTAFGYRTLCTNQTSYGQTAIGYNALAVAVGPNGYNVAVGYEAAKMLTNGASNVAIGARTLHTATSAYECVAIGRFALEKATDGHGNTALGTIALGQTTTGDYNVGLGQYAGFENTTESNRCYIGGFVAPASSYPLQHWWEVPVADIDLNKTQFDVRLNRNLYKFLLAQQDGSVVQTPYETQTVAPTMTSTHAAMWADASGDPQWSYNGSSTGLVTTGTSQSISEQKTFTTSQVFNTAIVVKGHDTYASSPVTLTTTIQYVDFDISGGSILANLPVINGALWRCKVVGWAGGNNVTLTPVGGTIDGAVSNSLALNGMNDAVDVHCNGTNFRLY